MASPPFGFQVGSSFDPHGISPEGPMRSMNTQHQNPAPSTPFSTAPQANFLAGADMSALEGISPERLAAIARLFQSGALQMPPPAPHPVSHARTAEPARLEVSPPAMPGVPLLGISGNDANIDAEEGEVYESEEEYNPAQARAFLRPPPTGPKNSVVSPREAAAKMKRSKASTNVSTDPQRANHGKQAAAQPPTRSPDGRVNHDRRPSKKEAAAQFVREMVQAGYTYEDLVSAVRDPRPLAKMFREINLPFQEMDKTDGTSWVNGTIPPPALQQLSAAKPNANDDAGKTITTKRIAPAKPAPTAVDRSAYLAKLQAAKNKKVDTPNTSIVNTSEPIPASKPVNQTMNNTQTDRASFDDGVNAQAIPFSAEKAASMTELARQKLEALKAKMAAEKQKRDTNSSPLTNLDIRHVSQHIGNTSPFRGGLGAGIADLATKAAEVGSQPHQDWVNQPPVHSQSSASPALQTPTRSFSGLPGLFKVGGSPNDPKTSSVPKVQDVSRTQEQSADAPIAPQPRTASASQILSGAATASSSSSTVPRKRAVASDFDDLAVKTFPAKRLFVDNLADGEDRFFNTTRRHDELDEEMDDVEAFDPSKHSIPTKSFRDIGPLRDFPPKANLTAPGSAPRTPDTIAYQQKMKEIEDFKRMIAEKEKNKKANGRETPFTSSGALPPDLTAKNSSDTHDGASTSGQTIPNAEPVFGEVHSSALDSTAQTVPQSPTNGQPRTTATYTPSAVGSSGTIDRQRLREKLRQRMLELEQDRIRMTSPAKQPILTKNELATEQVVPEPLHTEDPVASGPTEPAQSSRHTAPRTQSVTESALDFRSEESELSDSSSADFYATEEPQDHVNVSAGSLGETTPVPNDVSAHLSGYSGSVIREGHEPSDQTNDNDRTSLSSDDGGSTRSATVLHEETSDLDGEEDDDDDDDDDSDAMSLDSQESPVEPHTEHGLNRIERASSSMEELLTADASRRSSIPSASDIEQIGALDSALDNANVKGTSNQVKVPDHDLAPELQSSNDQLLTTSDRNAVPQKQYFTPYRSPLEGFKDYRYHSEYLNTVPGGYTSSSYTHSIDPESAFCPVETAGGTCNDAGCHFQHFKTVKVSDNEMLAAMSTKNIPVHSPEEQQRWDEGLSLLINELRNDNSAQDAATIATKIAEFRRRFAADPSKILNLD